MSTTRRPKAAAAAATERPPGPPPMTQMSGVRVSLSAPGTLKASSVALAACLLTFIELDHLNAYRSTRPAGAAGYRQVGRSAISGVRRHLGFGGNTVIAGERP